MSTKSIPKNPAGKIQSKAHELSKDIAEKEFALSDRGNYQTHAGYNDVAREFPAQYFPDNREEDDRIKTKLELLAAPDRPLGDAMLTDADVSYFQKKKEIQSKIAFDEWFSGLFDTKDINKRRLAQEMYPEYWSMREQEIDRQAAIQGKLAKIKMRGPADEGDLRFLYALQTGDIKLRAVPLYNLDEVPANETYKDRFQRGLFNPSREVDGTQSYKGPTLGRDSFLGGYVKTRDTNTAPAGIGNLNFNNFKWFTDNALLPQ